VRVIEYGGGAAFVRFFIRCFKANEAGLMKQQLLTTIRMKKNHEESQKQYKPQEKDIFYYWYLCRPI